MDNNQKQSYSGTTSWKCFQLDKDDPIRNHNYGSGTQKRIWIWRFRSPWLKDGVDALGVDEITYRVFGEDSK